MKTVGDLMTTDVVWVSPSARVTAAVILMKGRNISALPVLHADDEVVGILTQHALLGEAGDSAVADVMRRDFVAVEPAMSVHDAAEQMNRLGASHLIVMEAGRLAGIISRADLMPELGKTFDPLTNLPWSDAFREWAAAALKRGQEISVIFFDLDEFGSFNKEHGHVVGDSVIKEVAEVLRKGVDTELDLVCRYGGDEFVIASVRHADEARALANTLQEGIAGIRIEGLAARISSAYGMSGGRRTREREDIHYEATIDDLITRASKDCTARKPHRLAAEAPAPPAEAPRAPTAGAAPSLAPAQQRPPRLKIQTISVSTTDTQADVSITLTRGGREYSGEASGFAVGGTNVIRLVAEATAGAACSSLGPDHGIALDEVVLQKIGAEDEVVTVAATFVSPRSSERQVGSAVVKRHDPYRAAAAALLAAVNRLLETAPHVIPPLQQGEQGARDASSDSC